MPISTLTPLRRVALVALAGLTLIMNTCAAEISMFDFQTSTNTPAWQIVNDDVMGGVSTSQFLLLTNGNAVFSGVVSLENNGGFASVRSSPVQKNLGGSDTFVLRVRGDGRRYKFTVRTDAGFDGTNYQAEFATKGSEWQEYRLPFKDFVPTFRGRVLTGVPPLSAAQIASVGFLISDKQSGPFRLEIGSVKVATR